MLYQIWSSKPHQGFVGEAEAEDVAGAISTFLLAWPGYAGHNLRASTDGRYPATEDEKAEWAWQQLQREGEVAARFSDSYAGKRLARKMAYLDKCQHNLARAYARLDNRGSLSETAGRVIEHIAEQIERRHT